MPGRRTEERVKSNEATKGTRGSQRPSKGRAQRRGHGRHKASTTPHRDTGEGSTRGTREERHHAPQHARHRQHTHRTHPTSPSGPPRGRAVGGGTAHDLRRPSQCWKAPPPGTPLRHPHSEQRRPARAHAVGPVLGPHARTNRTRDTRVAEPSLPAPQDGRTGEGQRLTPGAPHNSGRPAPPGTAPHHPRGTQPPQGMQAKGTVLGPQNPHNRAHSTWVADPNSPPSGRAVGGGTAPDSRRPSQLWKAPPPGTPFRHPRSQQRRPARAHVVGPALGPHARTDRTRDTRVAEPWLPAREDGRPGEGQRLTPGAPHNGGRPTRRPPPPPRHEAPTGHAGQGDSVGPPHPHTRSHSAWVADPNSPPSGRAVGGGTASGLRRPSQWCKAPPPGMPSRHPHSEQRRPARAHAVGPVLGPHARTDRTRDTRDAEPWLPAPEDGQPGDGQSLTPGAPLSGGRPPPPGTAPRHPRGMQPSQGMQAKGTVLGSHTHTPAPTARGWRTPTARPSGRAVGKGTAPGLRRPSQ